MLDQDFKNESGQEIPLHPEQQSKIFVLRAMTSNNQRKNIGCPSRVFVIEESYPLRQFGRMILDTFKFKCASRELRFNIFYTSGYDMKKVGVNKAFTQIGQTIRLTFGPYNEWDIAVELMEIIVPNPEKKYPYVGQAIGKTPRQFPVGYSKKTIHKIWLDPFLDDFQNGRCPPEYYLGAEDAELYFLATNQCPDGECLDSGKECLETTCAFSGNFIHQDSQNLNNEILTLDLDNELPF